jgi:hypothetical protein
MITLLRWLVRAVFIAFGVAAVGLLVYMLWPLLLLCLIALALVLLWEFAWEDVSFWG